MVKLGNTALIEGVTIVIAWPIRLRVESCQLSFKCFIFVYGEINPKKQIKLIKLEISLVWGWCKSDVRSLKMCVFWRYMLYVLPFKSFEMIQTRVSQELTNAITAPVA